MSQTYQTAAEMRRANLATLIAECGSQRALADAVGVASAQISQWATAAPNSRTGTPRTISDESARALEAATNRPRGWMDHDHAAAAPAPAAPPARPPDLAEALPVVLGRLAGLSDYRADQVLTALQAAMRPGAPLEQIERDLLQWLGEPRRAPSLLAGLAETTAFAGAPPALDSPTPNAANRHHPARK